jgi:hypothetical protein
MYLLHLECIYHCIIHTYYSFLKKISLCIAMFFSGLLYFWLQTENRI